MDLCNERDIRALLARHGFRFSKSMGQNFLIESWVPRDIAAASGAGPGVGVVEVGPGIGPLTVELAQRAEKVAAVELDRALYPILEETLAPYPNVEVVPGDVMKLDLAALCREKLPGLTPMVCANLPYNITTPVITSFLEAGCFSAITVMIQREVAQRICAAPGGKSFAAAIQMAGEGSITSCDIHPKKVELIRSGAARLGISTLEAMVQDGKQCKVEWLNSFDAVLTDVPCSGLGIIRKKPDIRYKDPELLLGLPRIQSEILNNCAQYVRPQGTLLYATCTVLERENSAVVADFLDKQKDFTLEPFTLPGPIGTVESGMLTLWPHIYGTDGFFFAKLRRRDDGDL